MSMPNILDTIQPWSAGVVDKARRLAKAGGALVAITELVRLCFLRRQNFPLMFLYTFPSLISCGSKVLAEVV